MIVEQYNPNKSSYAGQRLHYRTVHFGKEYFWLTDIDGTWYMVPMGEDGKPDFSG